VNMVVNARDAMPRGGQLLISTERVLFEDDYGRSHPEARSGEFARLTIKDSGVGIAPEHQQRVFEAFWQVEQSRTRTVQGTGLGLALSKHLSDLLGARLTLTSELDQGTTVTLALPRSYNAPLAT